jgi:hypothetical protein
MIQRDLHSIVQRRDDLRARLEEGINSDEKRAELEWELLMIERELARREDS